MVIVYCQHFDVGQGRDHLFFWRQIPVPLVEVITCSEEEDHFVLLLGLGNAAYSKQWETVLCWKAALIEFAPELAQCGPGCDWDLIERNLLHIQAISLGEPTTLFPYKGKQDPSSVQHLLTPNQLTLAHLLGQDQTNSTWCLTKPAENWQQHSDELTHDLEQDLQLTWMLGSATIMIDAHF